MVLMQEYLMMAMIRNIKIFIMKTRNILENSLMVSWLSGLLEINNSRNIGWIL